MCDCIQRRAEIHRRRHPNDPAPATPEQRAAALDAIRAALDAARRRYTAPVPSSAAAA